MGIYKGFDDNIDKVYRKMQSAVEFETGKISANVSARTELATGSQGTVTNNDNGIAVTQNFYEKVQSPYETAQETKNTLRRLAYEY